MLQGAPRHSAAWLGVVGGRSSSVCNNSRGKTLGHQAGGFLYRYCTGTLHARIKFQLKHVVLCFAIGIEMCHSFIKILFTTRKPSWYSDVQYVIIVREGNVGVRVLVRKRYIHYHHAQEQPGLPVCFHLLRVIRYLEPFLSLPLLPNSSSQTGPPVLKQRLGLGRPITPHVFDLAPLLAGL